MEHKNNLMSIQVKVGNQVIGGDGQGRGGENQPCRFRTGKLQPQLQKVPVVMAQSGKLPTDLTQSLVPQLHLNPAKAILPPHGAAAVGDLEVVLSILLG